MNKYARQLSAWDNVQWVALVAAVVAAHLLWPLAHRRSYRRWRTQVVFALRLACFLVPLPYTAKWFEIVAPPSTGGLLHDAVLFSIGERQHSPALY